MLKQRTWLGIFFDMIFNHVVAQWSETTCFLMSKQVLNSPIRLTTSIEYPRLVLGLFDAKEDIGFRTSISSMGYCF